MESIYETQTDPLRPNNSHGIALQLVGRGKRVLELGAAGGHVTRALVAAGNSVTAVERDGRLREQLMSVTSEVHITDLDWLDLRSLVGDQRYDVILAGDVLEHCRHPELVLLQFHDLLEVGGCLVVSLPNIAHADVRLALLAGRFDYSETGLLDRTHVRFFTRASIGTYLNDHGFEVAQIFGATAPIGSTELGPPDTRIPKETISYVENDRDATVYQYIFSATPIPGWLQPESHKDTSTSSNDDRVLLLEALSQYQEMLERIINPEGAQPLRARNERDQLRYELAEARTQLLNSKDYVIGLSAQAAESEFRASEALKKQRELSRQLKSTYESRTWKLGRLLMLPIRLIRR